MDDNLRQLKELKFKVEKLINLHEQLVKQYQQLQTTNNQLTQKLEKQENQLAELTETNRVIRMAQRISGSDQNTRDIKLKINEYIREIDRCIGLINR